MDITKCYPMTTTPAVAAKSNADDDVVENFILRQRKWKERKGH
jgi:hypothetical protein